MTHVQSRPTHHAKYVPQGSRANFNPLSRCSRVLDLFSSRNTLDPAICDTRAAGFPRSIFQLRNAPQPSFPGFIILQAALGVQHTFLMRGLRLQYFGISSGASGCSFILRGGSMYQRHISRCLLPSLGQLRSLCFMNRSWLGSWRPDYQIEHLHKYHLPSGSPCRRFISSSYAKIETNASNGEMGSDAGGESSEPADAQENLAFKYFPIDDVERLEKYRIGGYHPIAIGNTLKDGRYEIVNKLGYGGYSTIWIAQDKYANSQYVAIKICISDNTFTSNEKEITQRLLHSHDDRASMILPILDEFAIDGPNGQHSCIVTPPARMSIAAAKSATHGYNIFPLPTSRAIAAQLAQVLAFFHSQGVVHGDLHTGNVLLRFGPDDDIHSPPVRPSTSASGTHTKKRSSS